MPFYRDILLALGVCSVSKKSCSNILKGGPGMAITIVVGGAAESLSARPGTADLTLRKRYVFWWVLRGRERCSFDLKIGIYQARYTARVRKPAVRTRAPMHILTTFAQRGSRTGVFLRGK